MFRNQILFRNILFSNFIVYIMFLVTFIILSPSPSTEPLQASPHNFHAFFNLLSCDPRSLIVVAYHGWEVIYWIPGNFSVPMPLRQTTFSCPQQLWGGVGPQEALLCPSWTGDGPSCSGYHSCCGIISAAIMSHTFHSIHLFPGLSHSVWLLFHNIP